MDRIVMWGMATAFALPIAVLLGVSIPGAISYLLHGGDIADLLFPIIPAWLLIWIGAMMYITRD